MNQRLFHVGLKIPETRLWDLMANLERWGAGDLEIRHVPELANEPVQLDSVDTPRLDPPVPKDITGAMQILVLRAMKPDVPTQPRSLTDVTGLTKKQIHMALYNLLKNGAVTRPEIGVYVRVI